MAYVGTDSLKSLVPKPDGEGVSVPRTRMSDPLAVQNYARRLIDNDDKRAWKRSRVNGLVDGNPPYRMSDLLKAGRAEACNVNWGTARGYLEGAAGAFYDLFSEAPGFMEIRSGYGTPEEREQWSNDISAEVDHALRESPVWDYEMSLAIDNLILHGCGPMLFEDAWKPLPKAFLCGDLKVPEFSKSDTTYWDAAMVQATYFPPELYAFIEDRKVAESVGLNVDFTRRVIANAMGLRNQAGRMYEWEFYQQELKNNSLSYYDEPRVCRVCHVFWREFDGRITQAIVERDTTTGVGTEFLYRRVGRYNNWNNVVHPLYFDHGNGGYHHSVTGLGVKMFGAMEYENRLLCNQADKAFSPKILFKPTSAEARQKFELATYGEFGVLPKGMDAVQQPVAGLLDDGIKLHQLLSGVVSSNLSSYRQQMPVPKEGNPPTKWQKQYEAALQSALSKTQFNRFYKQLDTLYREIYRRLSDPNNPDEMAKDFLARCLDRGVPMEALGRVEYVGAARVVGQGSAFMRKAAIDSLFMVAGSLPEEGRSNLLADKVAAEAGQAAVLRYYPRKQPETASDQVSEATQWVGVMRAGVPTVIASSQNAVVYASVFMGAAVEAVKSIKMGADPAEVLKFLGLIGPAIAGHLKRFSQDPTRVQVFKNLMQQWQQLAAITDKLKDAVQQMAEGQQQQRQATQQAMTDDQIKQMKLQSDIALKTAKTKAQLGQGAEKNRAKLAQQQQAHQMQMAQRAQENQLSTAEKAQAMVIKDATAAADIRREEEFARAELERAEAKPGTEE
jgi:hypothetical protein